MITPSSFWKEREKLEIYVIVYYLMRHILTTYHG